LLEDPTFGKYLGDFDEDRLTYAWRSADPHLDVLQKRLVDIAESAAQIEEAPLDTFMKIGEAVVHAAGRGPSKARHAVAAGGADRGAPRLTEPWFC
jgi:hypothetical protein